MVAKFWTACSKKITQKTWILAKIVDPGCSKSSTGGSFFGAGCSKITSPVATPSSLTCCKTSNLVEGEEKEMDDHGFPGLHQPLITPRISKGWSGRAEPRLDQI